MVRHELHARIQSNPYCCAIISEWKKHPSKSPQEELVSARRRKAPLNALSSRPIQDTMQERYYFRVGVRLMILT